MFRKSGAGGCNGERAQGCRRGATKDAGRFAPSRQHSTDRSGEGFHRAIRARIIGQMDGPEFGPDHLQSCPGNRTAEVRKSGLVTATVIFSASDRKGQARHGTNPSDWRTGSLCSPAQNCERVALTFSKAPAILRVWKL